MAVRRKVGNLAGLLLQSHLQKRSQENQSELIRQRQEELSRQNFEQSVLSQVMKDPAMAARLKAQGAANVGGLPMETFIPSEDEAMGAVSKSVQENPDKLDPLSIISQYRATPGAAEGGNSRAPIEQLIQQRNSAMERRKMTGPKELIEETLPSGAQQKRAINPQMLEEPIQTGLSAGQEGANKLVSYEQFEGSPEYQAKEARGAGLKSGAQAAAQLPYDLQMQRRRHLDAIEQDAIARHDEVSKLPPGIAERVAGTDTALYSLGKMKALFDTQGISEQVGPIAGRLGKASQSIPFLPTDPEFNTFLAETSTLKNSVIKAITGAQMSEPEAKRIMSQIPLESDKPEVWKAKALATEQNLTMLRNEMLKNVNSNKPQLDMPIQQDPLDQLDPASADVIKRFRDLKNRSPF